jgi:hypothetical protein
VSLPPHNFARVLHVVIADPNKQKQNVEIVSNNITFIPSYMKILGFEVLTVAMTCLLGYKLM